MEIELIGLGIVIGIAIVGAVIYFAQEMIEYGKKLGKEQKGGEK